MPPGLPRLQQLAQDARRLADALEALQPRLDSIEESNPELARTLAQRASRRLNWLRRFHGAVDDLATIAFAQSAAEAVRRTEHLDEYLAHSAGTRGPSVLDRPDYRQTRDDEGTSSTELQLFYSFIDTTSRKTVEDFTEALHGLLERADYEVILVGADQWGTWFRGTLARAKNSKAPRALAESVAMAAEDSYVRGPGAAATKDLADAAKAALDAMGDNEGCQVFDNLLVIKIRRKDGELVTLVQELTREQRKVLRERPTLIMEPATVLRQLEAGAAKALEDGGHAAELMPPQDNGDST